MEGDWSLIITGTIIQVVSIDVDKRGKHRKVFYEFHVRPSSLQRVLEGTQLPEILKIRIKDRELSQLSKDSLNKGDSVVMTAKTNGPRPTLFYMTAVTKLTP